MNERAGTENWPDLSEVGWRAWLAIVGLTLLPVAMLLSAVSFREPEPFTPEIVYGCYAHPEAPAFEVLVGVIRISQPGWPAFPYALELRKLSWEINAKTPLRLNRQADGRFQFESTANDGHFWGLKETGRRRELDLSRLDRFNGAIEIYSADGELLKYVRSDARLCG